MNSLNDKITGDFNNGKILSFRNKLDNSHFESIDDLHEFYHCNKHGIIFNTLITDQRFEIYSIIKDNVSYKIGEKYDNGIITGFFIHGNNLYIRVTHIVEKLDGEVKLKINCVELS
jgi:hypothetical protein